MGKVKPVFGNGIERHIHYCGTGRAFILPQHDASLERPAYPGVQLPGKRMTFGIADERVKPAFAAAENIERPWRRPVTAARLPI